MGLVWGVNTNSLLVFAVAVVVAAFVGSKDDEEVGVSEGLLEVEVGASWIWFW